MSFPSKNIHFISIKNEISAVVHHDISLKTHNHHRTDLLRIAGLLESPAAIFSASIHSRIQLELKVQGGCYSFDLDLEITM